MAAHDRPSAPSATSSLTAMAQPHDELWAPSSAVTPTKSRAASATDLDIETGAATAPERPGQSISEKDGGPIRPPTSVSLFQLVFKPAKLTDEVLEHDYPGEGTTGSPYLVGFLDSDAQNPMTWPNSRRWMINIMASLATFVVAFASSVYAGSFIEVRKQFGISQEVAILGVSLYVLGFAIGPLLWAPASELWGRQPVLFINMMFLTVLSAGAAGSQNIETLLVLRALAGALGCGPMTNSIGVIADLFTAEERGLAGAFFILAPFLGPSMGPIVGGFLSESEGWRWVMGLVAIFAGALWIACTLLVPETYAPVLLRRRAAKLSAATGKVYASRLDHPQKQPGDSDGARIRPPASVSEQFKVALLRPWVLLFREPIVFLTSIYIAIVYGTLYMLFDAFPIVFIQARGWSVGVGGLAFLGITVGLFVAVGLFGKFNATWYARVLERCAREGTGAPPEARLPPGILGSVLLPVGLFWFAWTCGPSVHWVVPIIGSGFFACGLVLLFLSLINYLVDSYVIFAASVLAANTVLRSLFGCAFPLFTSYMYDDLGLHWASSVPAFLALGCMPFPYLFWAYGKGLRLRCKYAREAAEALAHMQAQPSTPVPSAGSASRRSHEVEADMEKGVAGTVVVDSKDDVEPSKKAIEPEAAVKE